MLKRYFVSTSSLNHFTHPNTFLPAPDKRDPLLSTGIDEGNSEIEDTERAEQDEDGDCEGDVTGGRDSEDGRGWNEGDVGIADSNHSLDLYRFSEMSNGAALTFRDASILPSIVDASQARTASSGFSDASQVPSSYFSDASPPSDASLLGGVTMPTPAMLYDMVSAVDASQHAISANASTILQGLPYTSLNVTVCSGNLPIDQPSVPSTMQSLVTSFPDPNMDDYSGFDSIPQGLIHPFPLASSGLTDVMEDGIGGYSAYMWSGNMAPVQSTEEWESRTSLSSFLVSPISAERSTACDSHDDLLPQFTPQLPTLPVANHPSLLNESMQGLVDIPVTGAANSRHKSNAKMKLKTTPLGTAPEFPPSSNTVLPSRLIPSTARVTVEPILVTTKFTTVAKPITKSSAGAAMSDMEVAPRTSKRIPVKSRRNDVADSIGSDSMSFVTLSKENPPDSEVAASSKKRLADPEVPDSAVPLKYVLDIPVYFQLLI
jgi:hypothetical protein